MAPTQILAPATLALEDFFEEERRHLFRALCLMTGDPSEAEEIAQDAFLHVWERWDRVATMERRTGYLYRAAMNGLRSRRRRLARAMRPNVVHREPHDAYAECDLRDEVLRALDTLGRRQRAALVLTEGLGYPSEEAGRMLGVKATTIRSLAAEARTALRARMEVDDA